MAVSNRIEGSVIAGIVTTGVGEKLNPLWNPAEERAAGLPQHGEAHVTRFKVNADAATNSVSLSALLPIVQETFSRKFRTASGESLICIDSEPENLLGSDRPVNWAGHETVTAPFLKPGKTTIAISGTRSQNHGYTANQAGGRGGRGGNAGRGNLPATQRRLVAGKDFRSPMAPGLDGKTIDICAIPEYPHFIDHAATLLDPSRHLEWITDLNSNKNLICGYVFRREDYP